MMCCKDCAHLDKSRKQECPSGSNHFRYGCNFKPCGGYILGWIEKDNDLKWMGGSCFAEKGATS